MSFVNFKGVLQVKKVTVYRKDSGKTVVDNCSVSELHRLTQNMSQTPTWLGKNRENGKKSGRTDNCSHAKEKLVRLVN